MFYHFIHHMKKLLTLKNILIAINIVISVVSLLTFLKTDGGYSLLLTTLITGLNAYYIYNPNVKLPK